MDIGPRISVPRGFAYIWQSEWVGIIATKTERTQIHFLSNVLVDVASLDLKVPNISKCCPPLTFLAFPYICNVLLLCNFSTFSHLFVFFLSYSPPQLVLFVSLDNELYSTLSLLTQVSKWVPATYSWGVNLRWTTIPLRGSSNTPGRISCQGNWDKVQPFMPLLLLPLSVVAEYLVWFMHSFFCLF